MDNILDILQALALAASTTRTKLELWREITHMSDEWGEIKPGGNRALYASTCAARSLLTGNGHRWCIPILAQLGRLFPMVCVRIEVNIHRVGRSFG